MSTGRVGKVRGQLMVRCVTCDPCSVAQCEVCRFRPPMADGPLPYPAGLGADS